jgi:hypothetical protein
VDVDLRVGNPLLPSVDGAHTELRAMWRYDTEDSPVVPTSGLRVTTTVRHVLESPDVSSDLGVERTNDNLKQAEILASSVWSSASRRNRGFAALGAGTSFNGHPLPTDQFPLGLPFRLGAFDIGERRGDHYFVITGGYLREIGRLPDFIGGPIFAAAWLENGSAFDSGAAVDLASHLAVGLIMETAIGPTLAGMTVGFDGQRRFYLAIGRLFP